MSDTAAPAFLTALHLAMAIVRRRRSPGRSVVSPFVVPSFLFVATPWLWPSPIGLAIAFGVHASWLFICEVMAPPAPPRRAPSADASIRPATSAPHPGFVETDVLAVLEESADIRTFRLARPPGFEFSPGQFLTVRVSIDGKPQVRCYSISSAPHTRGYLEISVRRQGRVSDTLHTTLRAGSTLAINRAAGQFVYPAGDRRPLVCLAGGIGITPLISMLRHAVAADPLRPATLLYSARTERDLAFADELRVLAARHPQIRVAMTLTRPDGPTRLRVGRIDEAWIRQHVALPASSVFCICGPAPMIADSRALLAGLGVPENQVRYERFETAVAAAQLNPSHDASERTSPVGEVRVTFAASGRSVAAAASRTLLETAEAEGVPIPSSCRSGVCQSCRTRLRSGHADCQSDVLDPGDRAAGYILPCVTWPTGDCVLEA